MPGVLALVGGDEFHPGNEPHDVRLRDAAAGRPAYVLATAANDNPEAAVATAKGWFATLGMPIEELRARTRTEAESDPAAAAAAGAGLVYIAGGNPGHVLEVLRESRVWAAMAQSWRNGMALAGSSAGAMALCQWGLIRAGWPNRTRRRSSEGLGLLPGCAFLPHFDTFGQRWIPSAHEVLGRETLLLGVDERTAAFWEDGQWWALGAGAVTLVSGEARQVFRAPSPIGGLPTPGAPMGGRELPVEPR
ncbi:MAG TPA: Type 1 glutamine amidotransferase-like domain-containing protein [Candidatus Dormibacteraeota bacterium]|nr:Type 1 glutamine amidotransferase-like domain-containing protein [Candidatus Dormibacteraeota bacterium]